MAAYSQMYSGLSRAHLSFEFLHTNSTSHEFLFGALAEILDNSSDAMAKKLDVYSVPNKNVRGNVMLSILDDGEGMNRREISNVITFGLSAKKALDPNQIGQYGNGLKSASMRIANDLLVFTKKDGTMTCLMLSRTFYEREKIKEVIVPLPSFNVCNRAPLYDNGQDGKDRHDNEMDLILKYSPFKTEREFFQQFDRILRSGTLVILYNLKLLDSGVTELDFESDPTDILIAGLDMTTDDSLVPEMYSFRAYTSLLYLKPRMKIYIQKKKVQTCPLVYSLCKPMSYSYTSNRFKTRSTNEAKKAEQELKSAKERLDDAVGQASEIVRNWTTTSANNDQTLQLLQLQDQAEELRIEVLQKQIIFDKKRNAQMDPKTLSFIFGLNLNNRNREGAFIYNCNRLIKMYTKVGPQLKGGMMCKGVVCIVNVPYQVLEPTCSKQDFADAKEYRHLIRTMGEHMEQYWKDAGMADNNDLNTFWSDFGYATSLPSEKACEELMYVKRRATESKIGLQCDTCLKWRILPFSSANIGKAFPDDWTCAMNPDTTRNECSVTEEKLNFPEGFQKLEKSKFEKQEDIDDKIRKLEQKKIAICSKSQVMSSREAKEKMDERALINAKTKMEDLKRRRSSTRDISPEIGSSASQRKMAEKDQNEMRTMPQFNDTDDQIGKMEQTTAISSGSQVRSSREAKKKEGLTSRRSSSEKVSPEIGSSTSKDQNEKRTMPQFNKRRRMSHFRNTENPDEETIQELPQSDVTYNPNPSSGSGTRRSRKVTKGVTGAKPKNLSTKKQSNTSGDANEEWWPELSDDEVQEIPTKMVVGSRVEVKVRGKWYAGSAIKETESDFIIRLDKWPNMRFDQRMSPNHPDIRLAPIPMLPQPKPDVPSSSSDSTISSDADIRAKLQTFLRYFMPPQFPISEDDVNFLTTEELLNFDLQYYFTCYKERLDELIAAHKLKIQKKKLEAKMYSQQVEMYKQEATNAKANQENATGLDCNLSPDADSGEVNEYLKSYLDEVDKATDHLINT